MYKSMYIGTHMNVRGQLLGIGSRFFLFESRFFLCLSLCYMLQARNLSSAHMNPQSVSHLASRSSGITATCHNICFCFCFFFNVWSKVPTLTIRLVRVRFLPRENLHPWFVIRCSLNKYSNQLSERDIKGFLSEQTEARSFYNFPSTPHWKSSSLW